MKEYLPQETEETEQILEEEVAGGSDLPRRRKSGSVGRESEDGEDDEDDQLHSLISGLERPPSVEEDADKGAAAIMEVELEPEEEEFLPTVTSTADSREGDAEGRLSPADSPKRRGECFSLLVVCETTSKEQIYPHIVTRFTVTVWLE